VRMMNNESVGYPPQVYSSVSSPFGGELFSPFPTEFVSQEILPMCNSDYIALTNSHNDSYHQAALAAATVSLANSDSSPNSYNSHTSGYSSSDYYVNNYEKKALSSSSNYDTTSGVTASSSTTNSDHLQRLYSNVCNIKQESPFPSTHTDHHHPQHTNNIYTTTSNTGTLNATTNPNFGIVDEYSLYPYSSYASGLLQPSYPTSPYGISHSDQMRHSLYNSQLKHDFG
ncbi:unnamed protein product, partial [Didymodactylos carnosus]